MKPITLGRWGQVDISVVHLEDDVLLIILRLEVWKNTHGWLSYDQISKTPQKWFHPPLPQFPEYSVVSNWSYFDYLNYGEFLTTSSQLQIQKTINFSTQIQNYFLTSFSWAVVTFNLSQSDYLNLPVTVDKLLAIQKRKARVNFAYYLANKYGIAYLSQLPSRSFLSIFFF